MVYMDTHYSPVLTNWLTHLYLEILRDEDKTAHHSSSRVCKKNNNPPQKKFLPQPFQNALND